MPKQLYFDRTVSQSKSDLIVSVRKRQAKLGLQVQSSNELIETTTMETPKNPLTYRMVISGSTPQI